MTVTGQIDSQTKKYVRDRIVFADLFNYLIYDGNPLILPEQLAELDTTEIATPYGNSGKIYAKQKARDVLKSAVVMRDGIAAYALILGVENQTEINYAMAVKNMLYDAINYSAQISVLEEKNRAAGKPSSGGEFLSGLCKDDRLTPVITLVLYFGQTPWDGSMNLHGLLSTQDEKILRLVPDYRINMIAPYSMEFSEIEKFRSSFKEMAGFIRCGRDKDAIRELVENNDKFKHMDPLMANILNCVTGAGLRLRKNKEGEINMCAAIAGIREEGIAEGLAAGMAKGRAAGENIILSLVQKLFDAGRGDEVQRVSEDPEFRQRVMKEFGLA